MAGIPDATLKLILIGGIFLTLFGVWNALFIGSQLPQGLTYVQILTHSWAIFTQPQLLIINALLSVVFFIVVAVVAADLIP